MRVQERDGRGFRRTQAVSLCVCARGEQTPTLALGLEKSRVLGKPVSGTPIALVRLEPEADFVLRSERRWLLVETCSVLLPLSLSAVKTQEGQRSL